MQSTLAPGASGPGGHVATGATPVPEKSISSTATPLRGTLPVLVTWNVYVSTSPAAVTVVGDADLDSVNAAVWVTGTVTDDGGDTGGVTPAGGVPVAVAVLAIEPASMSAWVTV